MIFNYLYLTAIISCIVLAIRGQQDDNGPNSSLIPIGSILHYSDTACSTLNVDSDFHGYYYNPDAVPGTPETNNTYFCDPSTLSSYTPYGIRHFESCYVDNGGNWYAQPLGLCGAFVNGNETFSLKFWSIDHTTGITQHQVYTDMNCTVPKTEKFTVINNICQKSIFVGSYQIVISDAYYLASGAIESSPS